MGGEQEGPSAEEVEAYEFGRAVASAGLCIASAIQYGRFDVSWYLMTPTLRQALAMEFLSVFSASPGFADEAAADNVRDLDEVADFLAAWPAPVDDTFWWQFAIDVTQAWHSQLGSWWDERAVQGWRQIDDQHKQIVFADPDSTDDDATVLVTLGDDSQWKVAGFGIRPPRPGWPPDMGLD